MYRVWGRGPNSFFCMWLPSCPFVEETFLSPLSCLGILVKNSIDCRYKGLFLDFQFYSVDLYGYPYVRTSLEYYSFVISFEIGQCESSTLFILFKTVLTVPVPLHFYMKFYNQPVNFCPKWQLKFWLKVHGICRSFRGI